MAGSYRGAIPPVPWPGVSVSVMRRQVWSSMSEAERHLASAKASLKKGDYRPARDEAELAREKAMEARREAEAARAEEKARKSSSPSAPSEPGGG